MSLAEAWRSRLPWISLAAVLAAFGVAQFLAQVSIIEAREVQIAIVSALLRAAAVFVVVTFCLTSLSRESSDKVTELLISQPVPRWHYLVAKLCGYGAVSVALAAAFAFAAAVMALVAWSVERLVLRKLVNQEGIILFMATLGITFFLEGFGQLVWGSDIYPLALGVPKAPMFLLENAFTTPAKLVNPAIVNQFRYSGTTSEVANQQRGLLNTLLSPTVMGRLFDAEQQSGEKVDAVVLMDTVALARGAHSAGQPGWR